jgi:hypothetical protein
MPRRASILCATFSTQRSTWSRPAASGNSFVTILPLGRLTTNGFIGGGTQEFFRANRARPANDRSISQRSASQSRPRRSSMAIPSDRHPIAVRVPATTGTRGRNGQRHTRLWTP